MSDNVPSNLTIEITEFLNIFWSLIVLNYKICKKMWNVIPITPRMIDDVVSTYLVDLDVVLAPNVFPTIIKVFPFHNHN